eukprot:4699158-Prorocentrum_lima.AAC.1
MPRGDERPLSPEDFADDLPPELPVAAPHHQNPEERCIPVWLASGFGSRLRTKYGGILLEK